MNKNYVLFLLLILYLTQLSALAQYAMSPNCIFENPSLKGELKNGEISAFSLWGSTKSSYGIMASSTLKHPLSPKPNETQLTIAEKDSLTDEEIMEQEIAEIELHNEQEDTKCEYSAYNLNDENTATAWVEGVAGDGIGEVVLVKIDNLKAPMKIWAGYGKSESIYKANNRPAKINVFLLGTNCIHPTQFSENYNPLIVMGKKEVLLKDINGYQALPLPSTVKSLTLQPCEYEEGKEIIYFLAIEILSVYKGSRYQDTCISEIRN